MKQIRNLDVGGILIGLIILGVGVYFLLKETFGIEIPELDFDKIWPLFLIAAGVGIAFSAWTKSRDDGPGA